MHIINQHGFILGLQQEKVSTKSVSHRLFLKKYLSLHQKCFMGPNPNGPPDPVICDSFGFFWVLWVDFLGFTVLNRPPCFETPRFKDGDVVRVKPSSFATRWRRPHLRTPGFVHGICTLNKNRWSFRDRKVFGGNGIYESTFEAYSVLMMEGFRGNLF